MTIGHPMVIVPQSRDQRTNKMARWINPPRLLLNFYHDGLSLANDFSPLQGVAQNGPCGLIQLRIFGDSFESAMNVHLLADIFYMSSHRLGSDI